MCYLIIIILHHFVTDNSLVQWCVHKVQISRFAVVWISFSQRFHRHGTNEYVYICCITVNISNLIIKLMEWVIIFGFAKHTLILIITLGMSYLSEESSRSVPMIVVFPQSLGKLCSLFPSDWIGKVFVGPAGRWRLVDPVSGCELINKTKLNYIADSLTITHQKVKVLWICTNSCKDRN